MTHVSRRRLLAAMGGLTVIPPTLTGCGLLDGSEGSNASSAPRGRIETPVLQVGVMPIVGAAPLGHALSKNYFRQQRLDVRTTTVRSGEVAVPALVSGDMQITFGNYVSFIQAQSAGIELRIIAEGSRAAPGNFAVVALPDSPITRPDHLRDKRIGVNALHNIATLTTSSVLRSYSVQPDQVHFLEFAFPDMAATLANKQIEAAFLPEPFLTQAKAQLGVRTVLDPCSGATEALPIDGYAVTKEFAEENPNTVRAFQDALLRSQRECADPLVLQPELIKTTKVDADTAALVSRSVYPISLNTIALQRVADLMHDFGTIDKRVDVAEMVIAPKT